MSVPGRVGPPVMQVDFVVDDLPTACMNWVHTTGIGPFLKVPPFVLGEYAHRGTPSTALDFSVAVAQSGGVTDPIRPGFPA